MGSPVRFVASILSFLRPAAQVLPPECRQEANETRSNQALSLEEAERANKGTITYFFPSMHP